MDVNGASACPRYGAAAAGACRRSRDRPGSRMARTGRRAAVDRTGSLERTTLRAGMELLCQLPAELQAS